MAASGLNKVESSSGGNQSWMVVDRGKSPNFLLLCGRLKTNDPYEKNIYSLFEEVWNDQKALLKQGNISKLYFENILKIILIGNIYKNFFFSNTLVCLIYVFRSVQ